MTSHTNYFYIVAGAAEDVNSTNSTTTNMCDHNNQSHDAETFQRFTKNFEESRLHQSTQCQIG